MKRKIKDPDEFDFLNYFIEEMEARGLSKNLLYFGIDEEMATEISSTCKAQVSVEKLKVIADKCLANEWVDRTSMDGGYSNLRLTSSGFGVVRSRKLKQERLANRTAFKKASDFIEDHKGLSTALGVLIGIVGIITTILYKAAK